MKYIFIYCLLLMFSSNSFAQIGFEKRYGNSNTNDVSFSIIENSNKNIVIMGNESNSPQVSHIDSTVVKNIFLELDSIGNIVSSNRHFIADSFDYTEYLDIINYNNDYVLSGIYGQKWPLPNLHCLTKLNAQGDTLWNKINFNLPDTPSKIEHSLIVSNKIFSAGDRYYNPTFFCTDISGNSIFAREINGPFMYGKSTKGLVYFPHDSTFVIGGDGNISVAAKDKWMIRFKENGDTVFTKVLTNWGSGWVTDLCKSYDSNTFYMAGNSISRFTIDGQLVSDTYYNEFSTCLSMQKTIDTN